jgi:hypothetical protein
MLIIGDCKIYDLRFTKYDLRYLILASLRSASPRVDLGMYQFENVSIRINILSHFVITFTTKSFYMMKL